MSAGRKALPFKKKEDLECPASEGHSLHDLMNCFLRDEMAILTPITTLPEMMHIHYTMHKTRTYKFKQMAYDLSSTKRDVLVMEGMDPLNCLTGCFWLATRHLFGGQPSPDNNSPDDTLNKKTGDTSIKPSMNQNKDTEKNNNEKGGLKRHLEDIPNNEMSQSSSKKGKGGRKLGGRNWTVEEVKICFEAMEEILPCGREMWEAMAVKCAKICVEDWTQNGESCKKIKKMALMKVPTGTTVMPPEVKKEMEILEEIEKEEKLGIIVANEMSNFEELADDKKCSMALKGAKLLDEEKSIAWRPST